MYAVVKRSVRRSLVRSFGGLIADHPPSLTPSPLSSLAIPCPSHASVCPGLPLLERDQSIQHVLERRVGHGKRVAVDARQVDRVVPQVVLVDPV